MTQLILEIAKITWVTAHVTQTKYFSEWAMPLQVMQIR